MLIYRRIQYLSVLILALIGLNGCEWEGYQEEPKPEREIEVVEPPKKKLSYWDIRDIETCFDAGEEAVMDISTWSDKHGFSWLEGVNFRDSAMLNIDIDRYEDHVDLEFHFDLTSQQPFPTIKNGIFGTTEECDHLLVDLIVGNNQNSRRIKMSEDVSLGDDGQGSFRAELDVDAYNDLAKGDAEFWVELNSVYTSFSDLRSKKRPIHAKFAFNFDVPQLYKSTLYFKSLRLNKEDTQAKLGDNDFSDPDPEAGIMVVCNGKTVLYEFAKNSFNYLRKHKVDIYHFSPNDKIDISALDVDYGFNFNDLINDTILRINSLEGTDYYNLKMKYIDELLIYTQFKGKAN